VEDLANCVLRQSQPAMPGEMAVHVVEILQAAYDSARSGSAVAL
jgi:predicted dehydrogenase